MRSIGKCFKWMGRKYRDSVAPVLADYWYAARHHHFGGRGKGDSGEDNEDEVEICKIV